MNPEARTSSPAVAKEVLLVDPFRPALRRRVWNLSGGMAACLFLQRGEASLLLDGTAHTSQAVSFCWIAPQSSVRIDVSAGAKGAIVLVPPAMIYRAMPFGPSAHELLRVAGRSQVQAITDPGLSALLSSSIRAMTEEISQNQPGLDGMLEAHLRVLIITLWRFTRAGGEGGGQDPVPRDIAQRFRTEILLRLRDQPPVTEIARTLGVSCDQLNRAVLRAFQMTPQQMIHSLILTEAKRLLTESSLQVDQIAVLLGFADPAYFNRFFRHRVGLPPGQFRKQSAADQRSETSTFAAWP
ncbi:MAG: helix-turn-helix domain-containing protein [Pararhodobacter sp.]